MSAPESIGVLALQGGFSEHVAQLARLGHDARLVRCASDLQGCQGLILPGGESTSQSHDDFHAVWQAIIASVRQGMPCWGTCAGAILLARRVMPAVYPDVHIEVRRNAYGAQLASFVADLRVLPEISATETTPGIFIRAPQFTSFSKHAIPMAWLESGSCVALRHQQLLLTACHPELGEDLHFHQYFLRMCRSPKAQQ